MFPAEFPIEWGRIWGTYHLEIGWGVLPPSPDYYGWLLGMVGYSELGETTRLGWTPVVPAGAQWTDETSRALAGGIHIMRGRDSELSQINPGNFTCRLRNNDGRFSPDNAAGPLYGKLLPITPGRLLCEYGSVLTGSQAIDRASTLAPATRIEAANPVLRRGRLTEVSFFANVEMTGVRVGTFYETGTNRFSVRDYADIGTVPAGSVQDFTISLEVEAGDCIGFYYQTGYIDADVSGGMGTWALAGNNIPCTNTLFTWAAGQILSISANGLAIYPLMQFHIDYLEPHPQRGEQFCEMRGTDALSWLELFEETATYTNVASGALVSAALDAAEWPDKMRLLDTGALSGITVTYTDAPILSGHILACLESERGICYADAAGLVRYEDRHHRYKGAHLASQFTVNATMRDWLPQLSVRDVCNTVNVTYSGGTSSASDAESKAQYGPRSLGVQATLLGLGDAIDLRDWLLGRNKDARPSPTLVIENANEDNYYAMLGCEISDRITVIEPTTGVNADFFIESIEHEISGFMHRTTWTLSPCETDSYWLLGVAGYSELGATTILGY